MPANPRPRRLEKVTQLLREQYSGVERDWLPPERALARELEVSRPLLREAIKRLQMQGYLEPIHGVGVKVIHQPNAPIKELLENELPDHQARQKQFYDLRLLIEPQLATWAALHSPHNREQVTRLRTLHESMPDAPTYQDQVHIDMAFHHAIAELANNKTLSIMLSTVAAIELQHQANSLAAVGVNLSYNQHGAILQAIESANPEAAKSAVLALNPQAEFLEARHGRIDPRGLLSADDPVEALARWWE